MISSYNNIKIFLNCSSSMIRKNHMYFQYMKNFLLILNYCVCSFLKKKKHINKEIYI